MANKYEQLFTHLPTLSSGECKVKDLRNHFILIILSYVGKNEEV